MSITPLVNGNALVKELRKGFGFRKKYQGVFDILM